MPDNPYQKSDYNDGNEHLKNYVQLDLKMIQLLVLQIIHFYYPDSYIRVN